MYIRELAERAGVNAPTIRYYEEVGVMPPSKRTESGYRIYDEADVERLRFISYARQLDLSLDEVREILELREREQTPCTYVLHQLDEKQAEIDRRIAALQHLRAELQQLKEMAVSLQDENGTAGHICPIIEHKEFLEANQTK